MKLLNKIGFLQKNTARAARKRPRIFVNIASYRDPECQWTVKDLYDKAKYPDRIFVGICWQFDAKEDQHCFEVTTRPDQVRIIPVDWREAEGVCWARHQAQMLWDGEDYTLMTDSHMRFVSGWDELMIAELYACESDKPLLSCSPASYEPPDKLGTMMKPTFRRVKPFDSAGNIRGQAEALDHEPPMPLNGALLACGFVFSRSAIITEVPYDPYLYFDQEEITYSARLWTHGWDIFSARKQFLYHYYNTGGESVRPLHWTDMRKDNDQEKTERIKFLYDRGLKRFNHLTRHALCDDPKMLIDIEKYGFGKVRTLAQYERYTGIDFKNKTTSEKALRGLFIKDLAKYRDRPVHIPEIDDVSEVRGEGPGAISEKASSSSLVARPLTMLEPGDFIPLFTVTDTYNSHSEFQVYAGKHAILVFLPVSNPDALQVFFQEVNNLINRGNVKNFWQMYVLDGSVGQLNALKAKPAVNQPLWADPDRKIATAFGVGRPGQDIQPTGFVLSPNLQILHRHTNMGPKQLAEALVRDCVNELQTYFQNNHEPKVIRQMPPALIVPNVFSPEFCRKCIYAFQSGHTFEGTVGADKSKGYKPHSKIRTDHIVRGALLEEIDYKLSRSFFPEIEKIFGFKVKHRELYKIGLYKGEKKGFFKQHRDNFEPGLGYRRVAATIHLSDDYEGGGLCFPEYDNNIYRPTLGSGIAFSCNTLHEALPVTKGERYVLVAFMHSEEDEAYRRHYVMGKPDKLTNQDFIPVLRDYPNLGMSRDFYKQWRDKNVHINWEAGNSEQKADGNPCQERPPHDNENK